MRSEESDTIKISFANLRSLEEIPMGFESGAETKTKSETKSKAKLKPRSKLK